MAQAAELLTELKPTSLLHRTPWRPPVATSAEGIYITLEQGRRVVDGCGGAAVTCLGNGHPAVQKAIKDQVDRVSCTCLLRSCRAACWAYDVIH